MMTYGLTNISLKISMQMLGNMDYFVRTNERTNERCSINTKIASRIAASEVNVRMAHGIPSNGIPCAMRLFCFDASLVS